MTDTIGNSGLSCCVHCYLCDVCQAFLYTLSLSSPMCKKKSIFCTRNIAQQSHCSLLILLPSISRASSQTEKLSTHSLKLTCPKSVWRKCWCLDCVNLCNLWSINTSLVFTLLGSYLVATISTLKRCTRAQCCVLRVKVWRVNHNIKRRSNQTCEL